MELAGLRVYYLMPTGLTGHAVLQHNVTAYTNVDVYLIMTLCG
jgi:hypothetical protein